MTFWEEQYTTGENKVPADPLGFLAYFPPILSPDLYRYFVSCTFQVVVSPLRAVPEDEIHPAYPHCVVLLLGMRCLRDLSMSWVSVTRQCRNVGGQTLLIWAPGDAGI
jgi:hypothetical protein